MRTFTISEACMVSGANPQTVRNMVTAGLIRPAQTGTTGTGRGHRFSLVQVLALAAGVRHRQEGADPSRSAGVIRFVSGLTVERLEADLEAGRTFVVPAALVQRAAAAEGFPGDFWLPGMLIEPPLDAPETTPATRALMRRLDLKPLWAEVQRKAAKLAGQPAQRDGCQLSIYSTPKNAHNHAQLIRRRVDKCPH